MKKLIIVSVPYYEAFFDQEGDFIRCIHENDGEYRQEYFNGLFEHYGINVERFKLSQELAHRVDVGMHADKDFWDFVEDIKNEIKKHG